MEEKLRKLMLAMIAYNNGDAKRIQHFIKVHALAKLIGEEEKLDAKNAVYFGSRRADARYWHPQ